MDSTQSHAAAAKPAQSVPPAEIAGLRTTDVRPADLRKGELMGAAAPGEAVHKSTGYGLPCSKCRLYYPANLDVCPSCQSRERVSPTVLPASTKSAAAAAAVVPDAVLIEKEREAFLKDFKTQLFAAHAEVAGSPVVCTLGEHHTQGAEAASVCKGCYDRLQERVDVCEAALHIDLKEAAQIVYDAVWSDPSDPSKTYTNAASALLSEMRKRSGIANVLGPFQPLGN